MGRTACTEPQCLYKGALFFFFTLWSQKLNTEFTRPPFFVVYVVRHKFLNKSVKFARMFKLFHLNVVQIHVFAWPNAMSKRLHPSSFCNDKSLKVRT